MTNDTAQCNATKEDGEPCDYPAKYPDGKCGIHTDESEKGGPGRKSKFDDSKPRLLEAAEAGLTMEGCARYAGISHTTLYEWLDQKPDFSEAFNRARASGEIDLVDEVSQRNPQFILERSYGYTKSQEIEHTGDGLDLSISKDEKEQLDDLFGGE